MGQGIDSSTFLRTLKIKFQKSRAKILDSSISNVGYAEVHLRHLA